MVLVILSVAAAAMLGFFVTTTTERALERAEAFAFRRMLVARRADDEKIYRFFFATNREIPAGAVPLEGLPATRTSNVSFGRFDSSIEPSLGLGMLLNRTDWFQNEEIQLLELEQLERERFAEELKAQVNASPLRGLLIVVHGFREAFPSALRKTAFVSHVLDIDAPLLVFDWPGNQGSTLPGYRRAQGIAEQSGAELAETLRAVMLDVQPERVWLLANSMGAEVVVSAFSELYADPEFRDAQPEFEDVVLTAPDVSKEKFGARFAGEISALTEQLSVYVSSNDQALLMSRIINRERRLGESTLDPGRPDQREEAARVLELVDPDSEAVNLIDVTPINRTRNFHNFSLETPEFFDDLYLRLINERTPKSRALHRLETPAGKSYWVLAPAP